MSLDWQGKGTKKKIFVTGYVKTPPERRQVKNGVRD